MTPELPDSCEDRRRNLGFLSSHGYSSRLLQRVGGLDAERAPRRLDAGEQSHDQHHYRCRDEGLAGAQIVQTRLVQREESEITSDDAAADEHGGAREDPGE